MVPTFATRWLLPRLRGFHDAHPGITVNLTNRTRPFLFADTEFDAAIYFGDGRVARHPHHRADARRAGAGVQPAPAQRQRRAHPAAARRTDPASNQTTRPYAWREWFDLTGPAGGPGHGRPALRALFSMLAEAAMQDMGVALIPPFLIRQELEAGRLVVPFQHSYRTAKAYHLVLPERKAGRPQPERLPAPGWWRRCHRVQREQAQG